MSYRVFLLLRSVSSRGVVVGGVAAVAAVEVVVPVLVVVMVAVVIVVEMAVVGGHSRVSGGWHRHRRLS